MVQGRESFGSVSVSESEFPKKVTILTRSSSVSGFVGFLCLSIFLPCNTESHQKTCS